MTFSRKLCFLVNIGTASRGVAGREVAEQGSLPPLKVPLYCTLSLDVFQILVMARTSCVVHYIIGQTFMINVTQGAMCRLMYCCCVLALFKSHQKSLSV